MCDGDCCGDDREVHLGLRPADKDCFVKRRISEEASLVEARETGGDDRDQYPLAYVSVLAPGQQFLRLPTSDEVQRRIL